MIFIKNSRLTHRIRVRVTVRVRVKVRVRVRVRIVASTRVKSLNNSRLTLFLSRRRTNSGMDIVTSGLGLG